MQISRAWSRRALIVAIACAGFGSGCGVPATAPPVEATPTPEKIASLRKDAESGYDVAQWKLGEMYYKGNGVTKSLPDAIVWFRKAAEQGNGDALCRLADIHEKGTGGTKPDLEEAKRLYVRAAEGLSSTALAVLSRMYASGTGYPKDPVRAHMFAMISEHTLNMSARALNVLDPSDRYFDESTSLSTRWREELEANLTPAQIEESNRLAIEWMKRLDSKRARPASSASASPATSIASPASPASPVNPSANPKLSGR